VDNVRSFKLRVHQFPILFVSDMNEKTNVLSYLIFTHTGKNSIVYHIRFVYRMTRGNVPDFGRMFLKLKCTDIAKNTYIRS
jgi:hypothetical protein